MDTTKKKTPDVGSVVKKIMETSDNAKDSHSSEVKKWGNSHGIRLRKADLIRSSISEGDKVNIFADEDVIIITKDSQKREKRHQTLEERFADYHGDFRPSRKDFDKGEAVGKEFT